MAVQEEHPKADEILDEVAQIDETCPYEYCAAFDLPQGITASEWASIVKQMDSDRRNFFINYAGVVEHYRGMLADDIENLTPEEQVLHNQRLSEMTEALGHVMAIREELRTPYD